MGYDDWAYIISGILVMRSVASIAVWPVFAQPTPTQNGLLRNVLDVDGVHHLLLVLLDGGVDPAALGVARLGAESLVRDVVKAGGGCCRGHQAQPVSESQPKPSSDRIGNWQTL